jgi:hypothetical protein
MSLLLGFGHKARHGKDSACHAIIDHIYWQNQMAEKHLSLHDVVHVKQFRFAEALYEECRQLHGMTEKDAPLLQKVGAARRAENVNYWVDKVFSEVDAFFQTHPFGVAIITDVRYQNEVAEVKKRGGYTFNITRLNGDGAPFVAPDRDPRHASEIDLNGYNWDFYIKTKTGEEALAGEMAVTIFEYIRGLHS